MIDPISPSRPLPPSTGPPAAFARLTPSRLTVPAADSSQGAGGAPPAPVAVNAQQMAQMAQMQELMRTNPEQYKQLMVHHQQELQRAQQQQVWNEFFNHRPDLLPLARQGNDNPEDKARMQLEFKTWMAHRARPGGAAAPSGSGGSIPTAARQASGATPAALAGAVAASTAALTARAAAEQEASLKRLQTALSFLSRPTTPDEKSFLPRKRLATLFQKSCGGGGKLAPEAEAGVRALAEDFSRGALAFAVTAARRRGAAALDPADVAFYVKQTYDIDLPGVGRAEVAPYRRLGGSEAHKARLAAVRRANVAMTRQTGAAGGRPKEGGSGGAARSKKGGPKAAAAARRRRPAAGAEEDEGGEGEEPMEEDLGGAEADEEDMPDF